MDTNKQVKRINILIERLTADKEVTRSSLQRVLTAEQLVNFEKNCEIEKNYKKIQKPKEIKTYESMLRSGLLLYGKYESTQSKLSKNSSTKIIRTAESKLERALEFAQEMVQNTNSLQEWLDRDPRDCCGLNPSSMPRIVTSKSADNQSAVRKAPSTNSMKQLKLIALHEALEELQPNDLELLSQEIKVSTYGTRRKLAMEFSGFHF